MLELYKSRIIWPLQHKHFHQLLSLLLLLLRRRSLLWRRWLALEREQIVRLLVPQPRCCVWLASARRQRPWCKRSGVGAATCSSCCSRQRHAITTTTLPVNVHSWWETGLGSRHRIRRGHHNVHVWTNQVRHDANQSMGAFYRQLQAGRHRRKDSTTKRDRWLSVRTSVMHSTYSWKTVGAVWIWEWDVTMCCTACRAIRYAVHAPVSVFASTSRFSS